MTTPALPPLLYRAQHGRCFHCLQPMVEIPFRIGLVPNGWTREHVFPRARGSSGIGNNFVLAHQRCNLQRGSRMPTDIEIIRTIRLYREIGLEAFQFPGGQIAPAGKAKKAIWSMLERARQRMAAVAHA